MDNIDLLFNRFEVAYQHSLFAIMHEQEKIERERRASREQAKKLYDSELSRVVASTANSLVENMHKAKDAYRSLANQDNSIMKVAEYLAFGNVEPQNVNKLNFSDHMLPWVMPFLGHRNVLVESNGDACQVLGVQFLIHALMQTAPGQLNVTVINPELRVDFLFFSRLPDFKMLTKLSEIRDALACLTEEIIQNDALLRGNYKSLIELRKASQQPVGKLKLVIIQDLPSELNGVEINSLVKITKGAPRAGIVILYLNSRASRRTDPVPSELKKISNFFVLTRKEDCWKSTDSYFDGLYFSFPLLKNEELALKVSEIIEKSRNVSVITIPFSQIENTEQHWRESSVNNLTFHLGKMGLDTVSVCLGDSVTQCHNILISGAAGKGKSNLIEVMIHSLCTRYSPSELELFLLDFKDGLTFKPYVSFADSSWLPHARMLGLESDRDVGLAVLKDLEAERRNRAVIFANSLDGVHDFESYRKHNPDKQLPRIVLIVDEYQKLFDINDEISEEAALLLENLVRQGRACAIHIILASQSITGAVGLLGKDERIYAQFPIRIGLQNTLSESFSLFGIGNDAASKLQVRGEAIINLNYGAIDSNQKFTVAYAEPSEMKILRQSFCRENSSFKYPVIFTKKDTADYLMYFSNVKKWRKAVANGSAIRLPCGIKLSVGKDVLSITMTNDSGRNIAILGAAEDLQTEGAVPGRRNMAVGILQSFAVSLVLQHPKGNARFIMIDGLAPEVYKNSNIDRWLRLMERFGFPIEVVNAKEAADWFKNYYRLIADNPDDEDTYILGFEMDRCSNFMESDLSGESGASAFQELLKRSADGIHLICWWSNINMFKEHIGFNSDGYIGTKVLLRMDTDTAHDVLGPFTNWSVRDNRAYIHDASDLAVDCTVMPSLPISDRICGMIEAEAW